MWSVGVVAVQPVIIFSAFFVWSVGFCGVCQRGLVSVVVMAECDCVMLLLENVMLFKVLYSLLVFVL